MQPLLIGNLFRILSMKAVIPEDDDLSPLENIPVVETLAASFQVLQIYALWLAALQLCRLLVSFRALGLRLLGAAGPIPNPPPPPHIHAKTLGPGSLNPKPCPRHRRYRPPTLEKP